MDCGNTMFCLRWRKISRFHKVFLLFSLVVLSLAILDPCLLGLREHCEHDKFSINRKKDKKHLPFRVVLKKPDPGRECPIFSLKLGTNVSNNIQNDDQVWCKRSPPYLGSCDIADKIFLSEPVESCSGNSHDFCHLEKSKTHAWVVICNDTEAKVCGSSLSLGLPSPETGIIEWQFYNNTQQIADKLTDLLGTSNNQHYGFAFIKCTLLSSSREKPYVMGDDIDDYNYYVEPPDYSEEPGHLEQLLILPPSVKSSKDIPKQNKLNINGMNVNIVFIDSTSRQHFFRSLKKTVSALEAMASTTNSKAFVFDFELMQAVKSRTFETLQAIFSGHVNVSETPFPVHGIPPKPLNLSKVFETYLKRGYRTLWMEDLCYLWEWGIAKDLHFLNLSNPPSDTWKLMWRKLKENSVDDIGLTVSMCRILEANKMKDPFQHTEPVCFNGKNQHEYLLEYLKLYQTEMQALNQPVYSVTSTNVGHEETGRRIQTLDESLADYISFLPTMDNTLSIVFSDHGNAYGRFFTESQEARIELFHPFMFFIIPQKLASEFSPADLSALQLNSKRLISPLDLHFTLLFLASSNKVVLNEEFPVSKKGLFEPVDLERTCSSVPQIPPNLCICASNDKPIESSSFQALFAYHAVGSINREIQRQFVDGAQHKMGEQYAFGQCQPLELKKVSNIRETHTLGEIWKVSMDLHVQESQIFFVAVIIKAQADQRHEVVLETISRISKYGQYEQCADPGIQISLCICDISSFSQKTPTFASPFSKDHLAKLQPIEHFQHFLQSISNSNECLQLYTVIHKHGTAVFVTNICKKSYSFNLDLHTDKSFIFFHQPRKTLLLPGSFTYLALIIHETRIEIISSVNAQFQELESNKDYLSLLKQ